MICLAAEKQELNLRPSLTVNVGDALTEVTLFYGIIQSFIEGKKRTTTVFLSYPGLTGTGFEPATFPDCKRRERSTEVTLFYDTSINKV